MTIKTALVVLAALTSAAAVGCASGSSNASSSDSGDQTKASLHRAKGCDDLLGDLKADATWKVDHSIYNQIQLIKTCQAHYPDSQCAGYGGYIGGGVAFGSATGGGEAAPISNASAGASSSSGGTAAPAPAANDSTGGSKSASASSYSETNTQVKGVDEADIVKNDGSNIYVLHGRAFKVIHAFPATEMKESGSIDIDGTPTEMFVNDGKVVVYSQVNGADILNAAGIKARTQYTDYGIAYASNGGAKGAPASDMAPPSSGGGTTPTQPQVYVPLTKVTVLTLDGSTPVVTRESWFEGSYLDSRRVGTSVRTVFQGNSYGPALKYGIYDLIQPSSCATDAWDPNSGKPQPTPQPCTDNSPKTGTETIALLEKLRDVNHGLINASVITDWLPYTFVRQGGGVSASTTQCQDFYVPTTGSTESGITEVSTLDLADPTGTPRETAILGRADTVYGNADSLYVASRAYVEPPVVWYDPWGGNPVAASSGGTAGSGAGSVGSGTVEPAPAPAPGPAPTPGGIGTQTVHTNADPATNMPVSTWSSSNTHIHKFEFKSDPKFGNYQASGTVRGTVKDQFSLDEKDNFLRIATTEQRNYYSTTDNVYVAADSAPVQKGAPAPIRPQSVNHVFVLGQQGAWLGVQGDAGDLAANEQIYSVRFVDSRGYVVTYRQVDPLFVLDLSTPQKPNVVGELTIPGFSEYMHPLDAGHLLTIGRDQQNQLALQIFDVTNPANPQRTFNLAYTGGNYASSDAEYDHKAFTYFADKQLLAIPFYSYGYPTTTDSYGMHSSLEIFKIDVSAGIQHLGDIDGTVLVSTHQNGYCGGYYGPSVRRGVFLDNTVYAISYGGIAAKDVGNLAAAPITYALPYPQANDIYSSNLAMPACAPAPETTGVAPAK